MEMVELGKSGEKVPVLGIGTWKMDRGEAGIEAIRAGIDAGMRFVDTAEMYGTEEMVGRAIAGLDKVFVATKVSPDHFHYADVLRACDASLKRLGVKQIDLYQLHWPNTGIPIKETMEAMERLVNEGKIRYIGVSNFSIDEMTEAEESMKKYEIVSNQVEYSILDREIESGLLQFCNKVGSTVIAYSPLAKGKLFDRRYSGLTSTLDRIGLKYGKTASQVALNWVVAHRGVIAIPKAGSREHMKENAESIGFRLTDDENRMILKALGEYPEIRSLAGNLGPMIKRTSSLWGKVVRYREAMRGMMPTSKKKSVAADA